MSDGGLIEAVRNFLWFPARGPKPSARLYTWRREVQGRIARYHLRIDDDYSGHLIVNASSVVRLSPAGVAAARARLDGWDLNQALSAARAATPIGQRPPGSAEIAGLDRTLDELARPQGAYPALNLEDPWVGRKGEWPKVPLRADLALWRSSGEDHRCRPSEAAEPAVLQELLRKLWELGVPQVQLLANGPAETELARRAVEVAEDLGMVTGIRAPAAALHRGHLFDELVQAGVDCVTFPLVSPRAAAHDRLFGAGDHQAALELARRSQALEVAAVAELALTEDTVDELPALFELLAGERIEAAMVYALATPTGMDPAPSLAADALPQAAVAVREASEASGVRFLWAPPLFACRVCSIQEQLLLGPRCQGDFAIHLTAAGEVVAARGPFGRCGNLLREPWSAIAAREPLARLRARAGQVTRCPICPGLELCAADCPREPRSWAAWCDRPEAA